jgi:hypothetical protein
VSTITAFDWNRVPGTNVEVARWGHYVVFLRRRSTGAWSVELWRLNQRQRHEEHSAELTAGEARTIAEDFLLDVQGPRQRELVRRLRGAQADAQATRAVRRPPVDETRLTGVWHRPLMPTITVGGKRRKSPLWHRSSQVQALLFLMSPEGPWDAVSAQRWAEAHEFKYGDVHIKGRHVRLRQADPKLFTAGALRTISFGRGTGIKAIVGEPLPAAVRVGAKPALARRIKRVKKLARGL